MSPPAELVLDLDYPDDARVDGLTEVVRSRGRRLRRRRRALVGAAAVCLAAIAIGAPRVLPRPAPAAPPASRPAAALPVATGRGPGIEAFTAPGYHAGQAVPGHLPPSQEIIRGTPQLVATSRDRTRTYVFSTLNGFLCFGEVAPGQTAVGASSCQPLAGLPARGFWGVSWTSHITSTSPQDPVIVSGLIRGPVDRVVVHSSHGDAVAHLAPADPAELGTLFWAVTRIPQRDVTAVGAARIVASTHGTATNACTGGECRGGAGGA